MTRVPDSRQLTHFKRVIWSHYRTHARDLPWRRTRDPYKILVSEVMLQQTQVSRVMGKYPEFIKRFPTIKSLARAKVADILSVWRGLGYNRRALALKRAAKIVVAEHGGKLPRTVSELDALPGIGTATSGSIAAFAFSDAQPFIETNIRRVFIHHFFPRRVKVSDSKIMPLVEMTLDKSNPREWYWALMDYGSHLSQTVPNPNRRSTRYSRQSRFEGSNREIRSKVLSFLLDHGPSTALSIEQQLKLRTDSIKKNLTSMVREGFFSVTDGHYKIARQDE